MMQLARSWPGSAFAGARIMAESLMASTIYSSPQHLLTRLALDFDLLLPVIFPMIVLFL